MNQLTKVSLAWELFKSGVPKVHIAQNLEVHRETVHLWVTEIAHHPQGLLGFLADYQVAKKGFRQKRKLDGLLKERIYRLREENRDCCGQKIQKFLQGEFGIVLSVPTIYKVLGEKYKLRSKWKKNQVRGPVPVAYQPREVIQMDTVDFGGVFAFTSVDIFVRDTVVKLYPDLTSVSGANFLTVAMKERFKHTNLLQADGGPEFKDTFRKIVYRYTDRFRITRPYKKNEQSYIESFNRSLRKECLGWGKFKPTEIPILEREVADYLVYYHSKRPHCGLGMRTPNAVLEEYGVSDI
jgi:hypothetical protein